MFYGWASAWIPPLLGLLATASGVVLVVHLLGWRTLRSRTAQLWAALYVATAVALGAARFAFPIEMQGPSTLVDVIPLMVLPATIVTLYLLHLDGLFKRLVRPGGALARAVAAEERHSSQATHEHLFLALTVVPWCAVYSALAVLGVIIVFSTIPPLKVLTPTLRRPSLPELLVFGAFAVLALSRWAWIRRMSPPMARVSQNLDHSLARAVAVADERHSSRATHEHLLLALTDDPDAIPVMQACHVDIETLRRAISSSLAIQGTGPDGSPTRPDAGIPAVVQRAADRATRSGNEEVNGARVLVEMLAEPVGEFLRQAGMTRFDAVNYISHGHIDPYDFGAGATPATGGEQPVGTGSAMLEVKLFNDDFTPMEFVVEVLRNIFDFNRKDATRLMLSIHWNGVVTCGTLPSEVARLKVAQVREFARAHEHPLRCVLGQP
jgi:ATP-dependent Clp protease adapter protein ClpS